MPNSTTRFACFTLITLGACSSTGAPPLDAGATDAPRDGGGSDAARTEDASRDGGGSDAARTDAARTDDAAPPPLASCARETTVIARDDAWVRGAGIAPLGEGWAIVVHRPSGAALMRVDADGTVLGETELRQEPSSTRSSAQIAALGDGVLVADDSRLRFFDAAGVEARGPVDDVTRPLFGPDEGDTAFVVSGDELLEISIDGRALSVARTPIEIEGIDVAALGPPLDGYVSRSSIGIGAGGCLIIGEQASASYEVVLRTIPIGDAPCSASEHRIADAGSIGSYAASASTTLAIVGHDPGPDHSRDHTPRIASIALDGTLALAAPFGTGLHYGPLASIAALDDALVVATRSAATYGASRAELWVIGADAPLLVASEGASELTGVHAAAARDGVRAAAIWGLDSPRYLEPEHTLGLRCISR